MDNTHGSWPFEISRIHLCRAQTCISRVLKTGQNVNVNIAPRGQRYRNSTWQLLSEGTTRVATRLLLSLSRCRPGFYVGGEENQSASRFAIGGAACDHGKRMEVTRTRRVSMQAPSGAPRFLESVRHTHTPRPYRPQYNGHSFWPSCFLVFLSLNLTCYFSFPFLSFLLITPLTPAHHESCRHIYYGGNPGYLLAT